MLGLILERNPYSWGWICQNVLGCFFTSSIHGESFAPGIWLRYDLPGIDPEFFDELPNRSAAARNELVEIVEGGRHISWCELGAFEARGKFDGSIGFSRKHFRSLKGWGHLPGFFLSAVRGATRPGSREDAEPQRAEEVPSIKKELPWGDFAFRDIRLELFSHVFLRGAKSHYS